MKGLQLITFTISIMAANCAAKGQNSDELLNLLINKKIIRREEVDSMNAAMLATADLKKAQQSSISKDAHAIKINGYAQFLYQAFEESTKKDGLGIRRARLDFKGNVTPDWEYRLQIEMTRDPKILDAYAVYKPSDFFKVQIGQFKIPFSLENLANSTQMETIDRAQSVEALAARSGDILGNQNGRDIGIQIFGSFLKFNEHYLIDYFGGVFNGAGINTVENNENKDLSGRLVFHPISGLTIGSSVFIGFDQIGIANNQVRNRIGTDINYTYKWLSLNGEYMEGKDGNINRNGFYAQAASFIWKRKIQFVVRYDVYDGNSDQVENSTTKILGGTNYFINNFVKLQVNYTNRQEEGVELKNDKLGVQLQVSF